MMASPLHQEEVGRPRGDREGHPRPVLCGSNARRQGRAPAEQTESQGFGDEGSRDTDKVTKVRCAGGRDSSDFRNKGRQLYAKQDMAEFKPGECTSDVQEEGQSSFLAMIHEYKIKGISSTVMKHKFH